MKHLLFISILMLFLSSCKKEVIHLKEPTLLEVVTAQLQDSVAATTFAALDFKKSIITNYESDKMSILTIPFQNKNIQTEFILLKIEKGQRFSMGRIFNIVRNEELPSLSPRSKIQFDGKITIHSLKGDLLIKSPIKNGFITAFHDNESGGASLKETVVEVPLMPEVVVRASYPPNSSWTYSNWFNFTNMINLGVNQGSPGGSGGYYSGSTSGTAGTGTTPQETFPILIDFEQGQVLPAIDIKKYLQCFQNVPDAGATCTIKLLTDLPVDSEPNAFFNWENGSPGHTFLQITKVNGSQTVQQNIGFYPVTAWKNAFTTAPSEGKFVDNAKHEFNASIMMNLSPEDFQSTLNHIQYLANFIKYDIDEYNCTDFSLEVFNYKRGSDKIIIPMYDLPGGTAPNGTATPQGLYQKLSALKAKGDPVSPNITIPGVKGFVGASKGACN